MLYFSKKDSQNRKYRLYFSKNTKLQLFDYTKTSLFVCNQSSDKRHPYKFKEIHDFVSRHLITEQKRKGKI